MLPQDGPARHGRRDGVTSVACRGPGWQDHATALVATPRRRTVPAPVPSAGRPSRRVRCPSTDRSR